MTLPSLSSVLGHRAAKDALGRVIALGQVGHAYLFEGPPAVGKTTLAKAFLARLTCLAAPADSPDPCGTCRSCAGWRRGEHPDFQHLQRDGAFIKIEQVRDATAKLQFDPILGATKVVLVEDAEHLIEPAANALLKTLEEPPARSCFVLTSSQSQRLLQTIHSRCQTLRLTALAPADVAAVLRLEGHAPPEAELAAGLAQGSLHKARMLCDPRRQTLVAEIVRAVSRVDQIEVANALDHILDAWKESRKALVRDDDEDEDADSEPVTAAAVPAAASGKAGTGGKAAELGSAEFSETIDIVRSALRDAVLLTTGAPVQLVVHKHAAGPLEAFGQRVGPLRLVGLLDRLEQAEDQAVFNTSGRNLLLGWLTHARLASYRSGGG